jgi:TonB family protein
MMKNLVQHVTLLLILLVVSSNLNSFAEERNEVSKSSTAQETLTPGPFLELRSKVSKRIKEAAERGVGVTPYKDAFENIEASVKAGEKEEGIKSKLDSLAVAIDRQFTAQDSSISASTGTKDSVWHAYLKELVRRLRSNWHAPLYQPDYRVVVVFDIMRDGTLTKCKVTQSSGVAKNDQAALKAVADTTPYKPWPADMARKKKENKVTFQQAFDFRSPH